MPGKQKITRKSNIIPYQLRRLAKSLSSIPEEIAQNSSDESDTQSSPSCELNNNIMLPAGDHSNNNSPNHMDIFNSLRIPDAIKDLPKFDGNSRLLNEFINNVEEILLYIRGTDNSPYGQILLRAIRNKIEGQANEILNMYGTALNWDEIKTNLILHYADKRTETSLIRDLHNTMQLNKTVEGFYSEIVELQSALCNNILLHEPNSNVVKAKKELYADMCLNSFLSGLKEPLGSRIRTMRPDSLATALAFCIKEQNISYQRQSYQNYNNYQYRSNGANKFNNNYPNKARNRNQPYPQNPDSRYPNNNYQGNQAPFNNKMIKNTPHNETEGTNFHRKPNFQPKQSSQTRYSKPVNFNFNEINNHQSTTTLDRYFDNDVSNLTNIEEEQNFHELASEPQQGT